MSARTMALSRIHPWTWRNSDVVVAWSVRVTLTEDGESAFSDIRLDVPAPEQKPFGEWTRDELARWLGPPREHPGVLKLHEILTARLAVTERHDLDAEGLTP